MPEAERHDAGLFMERIRNQIASGEALIDGLQKMPEFTVSIGGAVYPMDGESIDALMHAADMALLNAKKTGRNCSRLFEPVGDEET
jgi:diguanylate cyclase (GGDEF)-like protein